MQNTSPTNPTYFANHATDVLERIVANYTEQSRSIALSAGADHPLSIEAMSIANAAWMALEIRTLAVA